MHKPLRIAAVAAACAVAGAALYGAGAATAGQSTANSTHEPYNIGLLVKDIDTYYGTAPDANGVYQASPASPYAKDLASIDKAARKYIDQAARKAVRKHERPAVVFDIDDTLLLSLDYEKRYNYTYNSATWAAYVNKADRPAVFGSPELVQYAEKKGVEVFYNSGLGEAQRTAAVENLKKVGADVNLDAAHMFLKNAAAPPSYLSACATPAPGPARRSSTSPAPASTSRTTSGTRSSPTSATSTPTSRAATPTARTSCRTRRTSSADVPCGGGTVPVPARHAQSLSSSCEAKSPPTTI